MQSFRASRTGLSEGGELSANKLLGYIRETQEILNKLPNKHDPRVEEECLRLFHEIAEFMSGYVLPSLPNEPPHTSSKKMFEELQKTKTFEELQNEGKELGDFIEENYNYDDLSNKTNQICKSLVELFRELLEVRAD